MNNMQCAITGASGYVGAHIANYFRKNGCNVFEMGRRFLDCEQHMFIPYQLMGKNDYSKLKDIDILIHCAYDFSEQENGINKNILGSAELFKNAHKQGVKKIIFISSLSAFFGVKSNYGKTKLSIEKDAKKYGAIIVRPGLIFGKNMQGIFGAMNKFVKFSPIVPLIGLGQQIFYPCCIDDLSALLFEISINNITITEPIIAAANQPLAFKQIVKFLAKINHKKNLLIPVPYFLLYYGMLMFEKLRINIGLRSDSLKSIQYWNNTINFNAKQYFKTEFRDLTAATFN